MTDAERTVIDAARALVPVMDRLLQGLHTDEYYRRCAMPDDLGAIEAAAPAFLAAVRALPRPLSEQIAELRVGAVVELPSAGVVTVLANIPKFETLVYERQSDWWATGYEHITRIISNPEADRG